MKNESGSFLLLTSLVLITSVAGCDSQPASSVRSIPFTTTFTVLAETTISTATLVITSVIPPTITTSVPPSITGTPTTTFPIPTGSGPKFTIDWPPPAATSPPYLTFYDDVKYTYQNLWVRVEEGDNVRIGLTDYGQRTIGEFQTVMLPKPGTLLKRDDSSCGFVQGGYMEYDLCSPVSGTVIQINENVLADYYMINQSPYDAGWLLEVHMSNPDDLNLLLTPAEYAGQCCPPCHCAN